MVAGRDALKGHAMWKWADEGEQWLRGQFPDKGLGFYTTVDVEKREVTLKVHRQPVNGPADVVFEVTEPIQHFVSQLTVTKIILLAG